MFCNYCMCYECQSGFLNTEIGEHDCRDSLLFPSSEEEEIEKYYLENFKIDDCSDDSDDYEINIYTDFTNEYKEEKRRNHKSLMQMSYADVLRRDCGFFDDEILMI